MTKLALNCILPSQNKTIVLGRMKGFFLVCLLLMAWPQKGLAYIPQMDFILKKATSQTGRKIFNVEQEVTIQVGSEEAKFNEVWTVEGDRNLKVSAEAQGLYKDSFHFNGLYNNKNKTMIVNQNKTSTPIGEDFYLKMLYARSKDSFLNYLNEMHIPHSVRLSRAGGVVCFAFGQPSGEKLNPHVWIGQEDFGLRKIRTTSGAEIIFNDMATLAQGLTGPKTHIIQWPGVTVTVRVKKVTQNNRDGLSSFYPQNFNQSTQMNFVNKSPLTQAIESFYSRFR